MGFEPRSLTADPVLFTTHYRADAKDESGSKKLSQGASEWAVGQEPWAVSKALSTLDSPATVNYR